MLSSCTIRCVPQVGRSRQPLPLEDSCPCPSMAGEVHLDLTKTLRTAHRAVGAVSADPWPTPVVDQGIASSIRFLNLSKATSTMAGLTSRGTSTPT
jgi:hypothetical protein